MASAEAVPFATTGGLGEVVPSLARALAANGHDVKLFIPGYGTIDQRLLEAATAGPPLSLEMGGDRYEGSLRSIRHHGLEVVLVEHPSFSRAGLYGDDDGDYDDNDRRFAFFCRGVLAAARALDFRPHIIHCHDWQTALIPYLVRRDLSHDPFFGGAATVFTIHNLAFQGIFPVSALAGIGLGGEDFSISRLEYYGRINLLKGALVSAQTITTVSPRYSQEVLGADNGCGLEGVLAERRGDLVGILNGIDYGEWDPAADPFIPYRFRAADRSGKAADKAALQQEAGLAQGAFPLMGMVTRLTEQKGLPLLLESLPWLLGQEVQLLLLGTGDAGYVERFLSLQGLAPGRLALIPRFDQPLSRRIFAGSDIYLMPSRFEPCGIGQLIALRYGTVPLVRRTGGLADTVLDRRDDPMNYTGIVFDDFTAKSFKEGVQRALALYRDSREWDAVVRRGMAADFSWKRSAGEYETVYEEALLKRGAA
jgi:starch synthase